MKKNLIVLLLAVLVLIPSGCSVQRAMNMATCNFKMKNISAISWAGIDFLHLSVDDLENLDLVTVAKCVKAIAQKDFSAKISFNVEAENPGKRDAEIAGMDYRILYKGKIVMTGESVNNQNIRVIAHGGKTTIPATLKIDLVKLATDSSIKTIDDVTALIKDIKKVGSGEQSNFSVQISPHIAVGKKIVKLSYITLNKI